MAHKHNRDADHVPSGLAEQAGDEEPVLKKYAGVIHIGADLTLYQRRAFNVLLFWAMPDMPRTTRHEINLDELAWGMGLERVSQRMRRLVENLDKMMEARVVWNLLDEKGQLEEWESATLLPYVKVSRRERKVTYEFTKAFQERVYNPSEFAEIALRMQRVFRSEHAFALYENTRRFLIQGETPWIPIETFRTLMGVQSKPYYDEYKYLNARLIKPAMSQVNACSDIQLKLKAKRRNRAVADLKFQVTENPQMTLFTESLTENASRIKTDGMPRLILRLAGYRIIGKRAEQLIGTYQEDEILTALDAADIWMEAKEQRREAIANPAGVAYRAITEGWQVPETKHSPSSTGSQCPELREATMRKEQRRESLRAEFRRSWYRDYIASLAPEELTQLQAAFEQALSSNEGDPLTLSRLRKQGLTGMVLGAFQHHLSCHGIAPSETDVEAYLDKEDERASC